MGMTKVPDRWKVKKLDSRYTGSQHFKYLIDFNTGRCRPDQLQLDNPHIELQHARNWFWTNYGPSGEYEYWAICNHVYANNPDLETPVSKLWAWSSTYHFRIYIKDDTVLSHWVLSHS